MRTEQVPIVSCKTSLALALFFLLNLPNSANQHFLALNNYLVTVFWRYLLEWMLGEILERPNELSQRALFFFSHLQVINNSYFFSSYSCFLSKIIQFYVIWYRRFKGPRLAIRSEEMCGHILSYCFKRITLKRSFLHLRPAAEQIISRTCSQPGIES